MVNYNNDALDKLFAGALHVPGSAEASAAAPVLETVAGDAIRELPIELLRDFATGMVKQPFRPYSPEDLESLRQDIIAHGIIQPLIVRPAGPHQYRSLRDTTGAQRPAQPGIRWFRAWCGT